MTGTAAVIFSFLHLIILLLFGPPGNIAFEKIIEICGCRAAEGDLSELDFLSFFLKYQLN